MNAVTSTFDVTAPSFEYYRALPGGVPEAIRNAIRKSTGAGNSALVLDLGAGSGRIGRAFVQAGDAYVGVDFSLRMLAEFRAQSPGACLLQADGGRLPFRDACFDLVLLMQVLSGAENWLNLLCEAARVIVPGGFIVVGNMMIPPTGVDAQMKRRLNHILKEMRAASHDPKKPREESLEWLRSGSSRRLHVVAASWTALRTPREFVDRHRSAARFSALSPAVQEKALGRLAAWAEQNLGSMDKVFSEQHSFELHAFRIGAG